MTKARKTIINVNDTPYYHVMGRCVRRAFLCGVDNFSGKDYSHRKQWIVDKLTELSSVFLIDVCAYAVMSNHYHLVIKINHERVQDLSDEQVIERWMMLFSGNVLVQRYLKGECKTQAEKDKVGEVVMEWRQRLSDISWFMRCLNETIAHMANEEDKCTGRFWEGRFKSQALLNDQALLSCMAYVDLNPIRADMANTLEESEFTSIEQRIREANVECLTFHPGGPSFERSSIHLENDEFEDKKDQVNNKNKETKTIKLASFVGGLDKDGIAYTLMDYLELVDWTGRAIRDDKAGYIATPGHTLLPSGNSPHKKEPKILDKLGFTSDIWFKSMDQFSEHSYSHIGSEEQLRAVCDESGKKWLAGTRICRELYHLN